MKKILLSAFGACLFLTSCDSDSNSNGNGTMTETSPIVGVWKYNSYKIYSGANPSVQLYSDPANACNGQATYEFKADKSVIHKSFSDFSGTCSSTTETSTYIFNQSNNNLTINNMGMSVKSLTQTTLEIKENTYDVDYNGDGIVDIAVMAYTRIQ